MAKNNVSGLGVPARAVKSLSKLPANKIASIPTAPNKESDMNMRKNDGVVMFCFMVILKMFQLH